MRQGIQMSSRNPLSVGTRARSHIPPIPGPATGLAGAAGPDSRVGVHQHWSPRSEGGPDVSVGTRTTPPKRDGDLLVLNGGASRTHTSLKEATTLFRPCISSGHRNRLGPRLLQQRPSFTFILRVVHGGKDQESRR